MKLFTKLSIIGLFVFCLSPFVSSEPYYWPEFSKITLNEITETDEMRYYHGTASWFITQRDDKFGDRQFSHTMSSAVGIIPFFIRIYDGLTIDSTTPVLPVNSSMSKPCDLINDGSGMISTRACGENFFKKNGSGGTFEFKTYDWLNSGGNNRKTSCLQWIINAAGLAETQLQFTNSPYGLFEGCIKMPPDLDSWCELTVPEINFEYGEISSRTANGLTLEKPVSFQCGKDGMEFMFKTFLDNDDLKLSNGMTAELRINGGPVSNTIFHGYKNVVSLNITSTLRGEPDKSGPFSGYTILAITYP